MIGPSSCAYLAAAGAQNVLRFPTTDIVTTNITFAIIFDIFIIIVASKKQTQQFS